MHIALFDTTLRDGTQSEGLSLSVDDKMKITRLLDAFGVQFVEGGYPGSNPKDVEFFRRAPELDLKQAKLTAFGSTRRTGTTADSDANMQALVAAGTPAVSIFGKSWLLHVTDVLKTTPEENLAMIADSVAFLKKHGKEVIFDAEHFFDGFRSDREYALAAARAAASAGADWIAFCDTNGGNLPSTIAEIVRETRKHVDVRLGIHAHNDGDMAVANSVAAVEAGCTMVQGTLNGWGERCGNANLMSVIPALQLKLGHACIPEEQMERLTAVARTASEIANLRLRAHAPYVGASAFAHKAGAHVAAVAKSPVTFEHVAPERVGNSRRIVVSELSGRGNIRVRAKELGIELRGSEADIVTRIKELENKGYQFEAAEGSFELMLRRTQPGYVEPFEVLDVVVLSERRRGSDTFVEATVKLKVGDEVSHVVAEGSGPVDAMDIAFHRALDHHFPILRDIQLCDFKVRILDPESATAAKTRVLVESAHGSERWSTIGVSQNIIEASCEALKDGFELPLVRQQGHASR
ncbi:MAG: citramalate synthase [Polyangiaceae bacterium]|nr:citramalate synthase [Polyangiaceae bacterium]